MRCPPSRSSTAAIADWDITFADTVADNASSGLYVLGDQPVALGELEPVDVEMQMTRNGEVVSIGNGAACLGDPLDAAGLAGTHVAATSASRSERARSILSGALGPMVPVAAGDTFQARIGGLGTVGCRLA